jgi:uncharacterized protein YciI
MQRSLCFLFACGLFLSMFSSVGCRSPRERVADSPFVFVLLKTGPKSAEMSAGEKAKVMSGHMANIIRLADERKLVIAGPFSKPLSEPDWRGLFVFDVAEVAEAQRLTATDPGVIAGVFVSEAHPWRATSHIRKLHDLEAESEAKVRAQGREPAPGDGMHAYVLILAHDARRAERALEPLMRERKIVLSGRFEGDWKRRGLYVLDAPDVAAAQHLLEGRSGALGVHTLQPWFGSAELMKLPSME